MDETSPLLQQAEREAFLASMFQQHGDWLNARELWVLAFLLYEQLGVKDRMGEAWANLGLVCERLGETEDAFQYIESALTVHRETGNIAGQAMALHQLGMFYRHRGENGRALDCLQQSLQLFRSIQDDRGVATTLGNMAALYQAQGDLARAESYYA